MFQKSKERKDIERYLDSRSKLEEVVKDAKEKRIPLKYEQVKNFQEKHPKYTSYKLRKEIVEQKLSTINNKEKYDQNRLKVEGAINSVLSNEKDVVAAARDLKISVKSLETEIDNFQKSENYEYDEYHYLSEGLYFTVAEEQSLLKQLKDSKLPCKCQACVLDDLRCVAYKHAISTKNNKYPAMWDNKKQAGYHWVIGFEMRHTKEISEFPFVCEKYGSELASFEPHEFEAVVKQKAEVSVAKIIRQVQQSEQASTSKVPTE